MQFIHSNFSNDCHIPEEDICIGLDSPQQDFSLPADPSSIKWSIPTGKSTTFGTFQDLADYMKEDYWTETRRQWRRWPLNTTSGQITVNIAGAINWNGTGVSDSNGIASSRKPVFREAFKVFEELLGIDFVETTSYNANLLFTDNDTGAFSGDVSTTGNTINYSRINIAPTWHSSSTN